MENNLEFYIKTGSHLIQCTEEFKSRIMVEQHNKAMKRLSVKLRELQTDSSIDRSFLLVLLNDSNIALRCTAANHCLELHVYKMQATKTLLELSKCPNKYIAFNACCILDKWRV